MASTKAAIANARSPLEPGVVWLPHVLLKVLQTKSSIWPHVASPPPELAQEILSYVVVETFQPVCAQNKTALFDQIFRKLEGIPGNLASIALDAYVEVNEGAENSITLQEDPPNTVAAMLRYIYSADYNDKEHHESGESDWKALAMNVHVHAIGDKYGLQGLADLALKKFQELIKTQGYEAPGLLEAIAVVYDEDEERKEPFRRALMRCVYKNRKVSARWELFQQMTKSIPAFASALFRDIFFWGKEEDFEQEEKTYRCPDCATVFSIKRAGWVYENSMACPSCSSNYRTVAHWEQWREGHVETGGAT
ncbi:Putative SKP1/BTB/POZ domain superfamily protein [Septoria linicola]|uniref:SKP1/BTB/POZ domain superfamily protein n=1 Tax=Septoria linicola TaxID=215465 RepID=A0A9Q9EHQ2_9PEZI|nr:putative SKP1/BTB/POZ domain superfamily protein [Septoria linicola]USW52051.1 Putative SKP1/BTB/POZ domain superfamily protein [Septoria linicola]